MWYTIKVGSGVANVARGLAVHMSHPGTEHWKALGLLIGCLKVKGTKGIIIRKSKVLKSVMFCDSDYGICNETRNWVSGLVATILGTLRTFLSKTQRTVTISSTEADYIPFSSFAQEVKFVSMFLREMTKVQKRPVIYEYNQGAIS